MPGDGVNGLIDRYIPGFYDTGRNKRVADVGDMSAVGFPARREE